MQATNVPPINVRISILARVMFLIPVESNTTISLNNSHFLSNLLA